MLVVCVRRFPTSLSHPHSYLVVDQSITFLLALPYQILTTMSIAVIKLLYSVSPRLESNQHFHPLPFSGLEDLEDTRRRFEHGIIIS